MIYDKGDMVEQRGDNLFNKWCCIKCVSIIKKYLESSEHNIQNQFKVEGKSKYMINNAQNDTRYSVPGRR